VSTLERVTDYGLGAYKGKPRVIANNSLTIYHRHNHNGRVRGQTWTEDFARNDWGARPCRVCWPVKS
jgi:hypothetical protein